MTLIGIAKFIVPVIGAWVLFRMLRTGRLPSDSSPGGSHTARYHWSIPALGWAMLVPGALTLAYWPSFQGDDALMAGLGGLLMFLLGGWFVLDGHFYYLTLTDAGLEEHRPLRGHRFILWTDITTTTYDRLSKYLILHTVANGSLRVSPVVRGFRTIVECLAAHTPADVHEPGIQALRKDSYRWLD